MRIPSGKALPSLVERWSSDCIGSDSSSITNHKSWFH